MDLSDVLLTGPVITFTGSGWYSTSDRHINLELDPRSRQVWNIPVITPMVDWNGTPDRGHQRDGARRPSRGECPVAARRERHVQGYLPQEGSNT